MSETKTIPSSVGITYYVNGHKYGEHWFAQYESQARLEAAIIRFLLRFRELEKLGSGAKIKAVDTTGKVYII
jgi:hypothetical protein